MAAVRVRQESGFRGSLLAVLACSAAVFLVGDIASRLPFAGLLVVGIVAALSLGYANGANDVGKAIATLVGSGVSDYRRAIYWGSAWTVVGALCASFLATAMLGTFTKGLLAPDAPLTETVALASVLAAFAWVQLATRISMPVSTTHAITGAVVGVGAVALGLNQVIWPALVSNIVIPLLASPVIAFALALIVHGLVRILLSRVPLTALHWLSSGGASFARGLNDAPKVVALAVTFLLVRGNLSASYQTMLFLAVAVAMGAGSVLGGLAVTHTLAEKVTKLDHIEGFAANLTTALLVGASANLGLPVSTTHVSSSAIIGIGLRRGLGAVRWSVVKDMALAWVVTLPTAAVMSIGIYGLLRAGEMGGPAVGAVVALAGAVGMLLLRRTRPVIDRSRVLFLSTASD